MSGCQGLPGIRCHCPAKDSVQESKQGPSLLLATWHDTYCRMAKTLEFNEAEIKDHVKMAAVVAHGISAQVALDLGNRLKISQDRLSELICLPKRTLHRRIEQDELLKQDESERVLRLLSLYARAVEVFEDQERATRWFSSRPKALGGKTPLEFMQTEPGARWVEDVLGRIEHGVFS
jgi:putative toxin-antitoxin system antitoxin component (TIGR02293 family)